MLYNLIINNKPLGIARVDVAKLNVFVFQNQDHNIDCITTSAGQMIWPGTDFQSKFQSCTTSLARSISKCLWKIQQQYRILKEQ